MKILAILPDKDDPTSFYRGVGPLSMMKKTNGISVVYETNPTWSTLISCDLLFMQRPFRESDVRALDLAAKMHIPIVVDYDDDLFNIPGYNRASKIYNSEESQNNINYIINNSDLIIVSTEYLKYIVSQKTKKEIVVIPNAHNDMILDTKSPAPVTAHKNILWRGGDTHSKDLDEVKDVLISIAKKFKNWKWHFVGYFPIFLEEMPTERCVYCEAINIISYPIVMRAFAPSIVIVPLTNIQFNHSKSMCCWLEATYAGAAVIAPNFEEWQRPGIINYEQEDFESTLKRTLLSRLTLEKNVKESWKYIKKNLLLSKVNKQRFTLFEKVCKR